MALHPTQAHWFEARIPWEHRMHAHEQPAGRMPYLPEPKRKTNPTQCRRSANREIGSLSPQRD